MMPQIITLTLEPPTNSAIAFIVEPIGISLSVGMPFRAMGFTSVFCAFPSAPQYIDPNRYRFKMPGIGTKYPGAKMVNRESFRNGASQQFISQTMRPNPFPVESELPITISCWSRSPQPTGSTIPKRSMKVDFRPEAGELREEFQGCNLKVHRKLTPFGAVHRAVTTAPVPSIVSQEAYQCET